MTEGQGTRWGLRCDEGYEVSSVVARSTSEAWEKAKAKGWTCQETPWGTLTLCPEHAEEARR